MKQKQYPSATADPAREARLSAALRDNLRRRKEQAREREATEKAAIDQLAGDRDLSRDGRVK